MAGEDGPPLAEGVKRRGRTDGWAEFILLITPFMEITICFRRISTSADRVCASRSLVRNLWRSVWWVSVEWVRNVNRDKPQQWQHHMPIYGAKHTETLANAVYITHLAASRRFRAMTVCKQLLVTESSGHCAPSLQPLVRKTASLSWVKACMTCTGLLRGLSFLWEITRPRELS